METQKIREPLSDEGRALFEGYAAAIFARTGMNCLPFKNCVLKSGETGWLRSS